MANQITDLLTVEISELSTPYQFESTGGLLTRIHERSHDPIPLQMSFNVFSNATIFVWTGQNAVRVSLAFWPLAVWTRGGA